MTEYFDTVGDELQRLKRKLVNVGSDNLGKMPQLIDEIDEIDARIVWDVSLCSACPGFPGGLADQIDKIVLLRSAARQPVNAAAPPIYDTPLDHIEGIVNMCSELHDVFHKLAEVRYAGFSDDPRTPLRIMYSRSEERRERLIDDDKQMIQSDSEEEYVLIEVREDQVRDVDYTKLDIDQLNAAREQIVYALEQAEVGAFDELWSSLEPIDGRSQRELFIENSKIRLGEIETQIRRVTAH